MLLMGEWYFEYRTKSEYNKTYPTPLPTGFGLIHEWRMMMKQPIFGAIACLLLPAASHADIGGLPLQLAFGLKSFYTYLDEPFPVLNETNALSVRSKKRELLFIPMASVRFDRFFATASWSPSHDFKMDIPAQDVTGYLVWKNQFAPNSQPKASFTTTFKRQEQDANIGFSLLPSASVTVGYKKVKYSGTFSGSRIENAGGFVEDPNKYSFDYLYQGPTVGFAATAPVGHGFSLYGNLAVGVGFKLESSGVKSDAEYNAHEVGLSYQLPVNLQPMKSLLATAGYRGQSLTSTGTNDFGSKTHLAERTEGFTLGIVGAF